MGAWRLSISFEASPPRTAIAEMPSAASALMGATRKIGFRRELTCEIVVALGISLAKENPHGQASDMTPVVYFWRIKPGKKTISNIWEKGPTKMLFGF